MKDPADASRITQLSDGTPGGLRRLIDLFITHSSDTAAQLRSAVSDSRPADIEMLAHRAAGTAGAFGASRLMGLLRQIESQARQPPPEGLAALVVEVEAELARVHAFLAEIADQHGRES
jgi:HPt (histidine-containing phosphotransfer) domain-containing protein